MKKITLSIVRIMAVLALVAAAPVVVHAASASYEYDDLGRLVRIVYDDGTVLEIVYDPAGNRTVRAVTPPA